MGVAPSVGLLSPTHFWASSYTPVPPDLSSWDPDSQPSRYRDGFSHAILELFVRLRDRAAPVTLGKAVPAAARVLVVFSKSLGKRAWPCFLTASSGRTVVLVHSDRPYGWRHPRCEFEVRAEPSVTHRRDEVWLPLLPQRGLERRVPGLFASRIAYKGLEANIPDWLRDRDFLHSLAENGWDLSLQTEVDNQHKQWPDFRHVDVALCLRRELTTSSRPTAARSRPKPPTKLINAWAAGAIPICGPESGHLALLRDGEDGLLLPEPSPTNLLAALSVLRQEERQVGYASWRCPAATRVLSFTRPDPLGPPVEPGRAGSPPPDCDSLKGDSHRGCSYDTAAR